MTTSHGERRTERGWTVDASTLGARLALVRHRMNWNVKEAARECGVPAASWRSWEEGAQPRRVFEVLGLIAERTGADYMWLLMGDKRPEPGANSTYFPVATERTPRDQPKDVTRPTGRSAESTRPPAGPRSGLGDQKSGPQHRRPRVSSRLVGAQS